MATHDRAPVGWGHSDVVTDIGRAKGTPVCAFHYPLALSALANACSDSSFWRESNSLTSAS